MEWNDDIRKALRRPFPVQAVKWKAQAVNDKENPTQALAVAYIDARNVMERLDMEVGPGGWSDEYDVIVAAQNEYVVQCALTVLGVTKEDVGDSSAASGSGSNLAKAAYSDALKRAAIKFGVGRYIYALPTRWVACEKRGRNIRLKEVPELPAWARPTHIGEEPTEDPGESLPDPELELVTGGVNQEEPTTTAPKQKTARQTNGGSRNAKDVEMTFGKHNGKTLWAIEQETFNADRGTSYLDWIVANLDVKEGSRYEQQRREIIAAAQAIINARAGASAKHWAESDVNLRSFWAEVRGELGLSSAQVHKAMGVEHLTEYQGTMRDAIGICEMLSEDVANKVVA